jgi:phage terminase Nu1 subunit (DNA packaging protein)
MTDGNVIGLPVPTDERYVDARELAQMMGVSVTTVRKLVREGMPHDRWGVRVVRFRPKLAMAWAREREAARRAA